MVFAMVKCICLAGVCAITYMKLVVGAGILPEAWGNNTAFPALTQLSLYFNQLSGGFPDNWFVSKASSVQTILLPGNDAMCEPVRGRVMGAYGRNCGDTGCGIVFPTNCLDMGCTLDVAMEVLTQRAQNPSACHLSMGPGGELTLGEGCTGPVGKPWHC